MFISGTHKNPYNRSSQYSDWFDWHRILLNKVKTTARYKQAQEMLELYPNVNRLVGHSYGSSIGQILMKENPHLSSATLYSAPIITGMRDSRIKYKSHRGDPVGLLTITPERNIYMGDPHSYRGFHREITEETHQQRYYDAQSRFIQRMERGQALNIAFPDD
jgi:pimeloyl-ACP methyl ester carboxylesterase